MQPKISKAPANAAFRHPEAAGKARVVWNWMHTDHVETGLVIVR